MLTTQPISSLKISIKERPSILDEKTIWKIDKIWDNAIIAKQNSLFNGNILSVISVSDNTINTFKTQYKEFYAQQTQPELYNKLKIEALAVSGLLECPQGIIIGLRNRTLQNDQCWELVPSGSVELDNITSKAKNNLHIDQIMKELNEEIGLKENDICEINPFILVRDHINHVLDIGIHLRSSHDFKYIEKIFVENSAKEYKAIKTIPSIKNKGNFDTDTIEVSKLLIKHYYNSTKEN